MTNFTWWPQRRVGGDERHDRSPERHRERGWRHRPAATWRLPRVSLDLQRRIGAGVRRRRVRAAVVGGAIALVVAAAGVLVPQLFSAAPLPPASTEGTRTVVVTTDGLISYDDGSMSVLTSHGELIDVPPRGEAEPTLRTLTADDACAAEPADLPAELDALLDSRLESRDLWPAACSSWTVRRTRSARART